MSCLPRLRASAPLRPVSVVAVVLAALSCSDSSSGGSAGPPGDLALDSTRVCALVPARHPAAAAFPPAQPVEVFGTDLGWTYRNPDGSVPILFGDTWQRIDVCPIQTNDDSMGILELPADDWPGFTTTESIPDSQCLNVDYFVDEAGTAFAPIIETRVPWRCPEICMDGLYGGSGRDGERDRVRPVGFAA